MAFITQHSTLNTQHSGVERQNGLTEEAFSSGFKATQSPAWLSSFRQTAWEQFRSLPMPSSAEEDWRRTDVSFLNFSEFSPFPCQSQKTKLPAWVKKRSSPGEDNGFIFLQNGVILERRIKDSLENQGVLFLSLKLAAETAPELLQKYQSFPFDHPSHKKFTALNRAFWADGVFMYVPKNVRVEKPLHSLFFVDKEKSAACPYILIVLDRGAEATVIDEYISVPSSEPSLSSALIEIHLKEGARLRYFQVQRFAENVYNFFTQRTHMHADSDLLSISVAPGSRITKGSIETYLTGSGANSNIYGLVRGKREQHFDNFILQDHQAPNTTSDMLFKVALEDRARSVFNGLIEVRKQAQKVTAYQANRNILLSSEAKADFIPRLEIQADDVKCTHGATVGTIDEEQGFYLRSRGLNSREAEQMILSGFFEELLLKITDEKLRERLRKSLWENELL